MGSRGADAAPTRRTASQRDSRRASRGEPRASRGEPRASRGEPRRAPRARPPRAWVAIAASTALLLGCTSEPEADPAPTSRAAQSTEASPSKPPEPSTSSPSATDALREVRPTGTPRDVATGLDAPWSVAFLGDTALVSERDSARILELRTDGSTRVVGTVPGVTAYGEAGLLGLAIDEDERLYAYSTGDDGNRVHRFALRGQPGSLSLSDPTTILEGIPAAANHDGGRIAFGPDGMLYVGTGDAAVRARAQDRDSLAGKILRMTPDGDVPDDNPFSGSLVYSYGHRNVQGLTWSAEGTMFATEFGQNTWDELNIIEPGGNYGWPVVEGRSDDDDFVDPVQQWRPSEASPSGLAAAAGTLFVANLRGQVLRSVPVEDPSESAEHYDRRYGRLRDVVVSPDGELWVLTNNTDGRGNPRRGDDRILGVTLS